MLNTPTDRLPTTAELHLWKLDLAKRLVRAGQLAIITQTNLDKQTIDSLFGTLQAREENVG